MLTCWNFQCRICNSESTTVRSMKRSSNELDSSHIGCRGYRWWQNHIAESTERWSTVFRSIKELHPVPHTWSWRVVSESIYTRVKGELDGLAGFWQLNDPFTLYVERIRLRPVGGLETATVSCQCPSTLITVSLTCSSITSQREATVAAAAKASNDVRTHMFTPSISS